MSRLRRRAVAMASSGLLAGVIAAAPAHAATTVTPKVTAGTATSMSATSEMLTGTIDNGGKTVLYVFEYGATMKYGTATPPHKLIGKAGAQTVTAVIKHLKPHSNYHWTVVAIAGSGQSLHRFSGKDMMFQTGATGTLMLGARRLTVLGGRLGTPLTCNSTLDCKGKFSVGTRTRDLKTKKLITAVCVSGQSFSIKAHKSMMIRARVLRGCLTLLKHNRTIKVKVTSYPRTGQKALIAPGVAVTFKS